MAAISQTFSNGFSLMLKKFGISIRISLKFDFKGPTDNIGLGN